MTSGRIFASLFSAPVATVALGAALSGCGTAGMTDAMAPVAQPSVQTRLPAPGSTTYVSSNTQEAAQEAGARAAQARRAQDVAVVQPTGPQNRGAFPNLNIRPGAANAQLSPEDSKALLADLRSTQGRVSAANMRAARTMPDADSLRRIGSAHGDEALRAIESESAAQ